MIFDLPLLFLWRSAGVLERPADTKAGTGVRVARHPAHVARPSAGQPRRCTATGPLQHLSLLFVPAGVGVIIHAARITGHSAAVSGGARRQHVAGDGAHDGLVRTPHARWRSGKGAVTASVASFRSTCRRADALADAHARCLRPRLRPVSLGGCQPAAQPSRDRRVLILVVLAASRTSYQTYFESVHRQGPIHDDSGQLRSASRAATR